jgi:hypothetical protein
MTYEERARIDALAARGKRFVNPSFAPKWDE